MATQRRAPGPAEAPTGRLFFAVPLPEAVLDELAAARARFEGAGALALRWVPADRMHLTLRFLGETPLNLTEPLRAAMSETAASTPPLELTLARWGTFGGGRPRVLWVGMDGDVAGLQTLAEALAGALAPLGFEPDDRPFRPHLTLARVRERADRAEREALAAAVESIAPPRRLPVPIREIRLIRSHLGRGAPRYEDLGRALLAG